MRSTLALVVAEERIEHIYKETNDNVILQVQLVNRGLVFQKGHVCDSNQEGQPGDLLLGFVDNYGLVDDKSSPGMNVDQRRSMIILVLLCKKFWRPRRCDTCEPASIVL